jgi:hypothetical protein
MGVALPEPILAQAEKIGKHFSELSPGYSILAHITLLSLNLTYETFLLCRRRR